MMRALFLLDGGERRIRNMQHQLRLLAENMKDPDPADPTVAKPTPASFVHLFRFARACDVSEETVLDAPIWCDWRGNKLPLFNSSARKEQGDE